MSEKELTPNEKITRQSVLGTLCLVGGIILVGMAMSADEIFLATALLIIPALGIILLKGASQIHKEEGRREGVFRYDGDKKILYVAQTSELLSRVLKAEKSFDVSTRITPSETRFTAYSVGGFTTGKVYQTGEKVHTGVSSNGLYNISYNNGQWNALDCIELSSELYNEAKKSNSSILKYCNDKGQIKTRHLEKNVCDFLIYWLTCE